MFVRSLLSVTFVEFTSKFLVKVSLREYISLTTHQKAFIFKLWVQLLCHEFWPKGSCPAVGLKVKIWDTVKMCFYLPQSFWLKFL